MPAQTGYIGGMNGYQDAFLMKRVFFKESSGFVQKKPGINQVAKSRVIGTGQNSGPLIELFGSCNPMRMTAICRDLNIWYRLAQSETALSSVSGGNPRAGTIWPEHFRQGRWSDKF